MSFSQNFAPPSLRASYATGQLHIKFNARRASMDAYTEGIWRYVKISKNQT